MRRFLPAVLVVVLACGSKPSASEAESVSLPESRLKVLFVIAHQGFRDEELAAPRKILEEGGFAGVIASTDTTVATGMLGAKVEPDLLISQANSENYEALVIVGGIGAKNLWGDTTLARLAREFRDQDKVLGAICLAPVVFTRAGILKGMDATCFSSVASELKAGGANYLTEDVVCSGKIVTASGPRAAEAFGHKLLSLLKKEEE
jgi:protease I